MNHQQQNNNSQVNEPVTTQEAIDLLFGEGWLDEAVRIEDENSGYFKLTATTLGKY